RDSWARGSGADDFPIANRSRDARPERRGDGTMMYGNLTRPSRWAVALALTALAVTISYQWLDRPVAYFTHAHFHNEPLFARLTLIPEYFAPLAVLAFIVLGLRALLEKPLTRAEAVVLLCALSLVIATAIKNQLKIVFGRTWPETWVRNNPSLIHDGVY